MTDRAVVEQLTIDLEWPAELRVTVMNLGPVTLRRAIDCWGHWEMPSAMRLRREEVLRPAVLN